MNIEKIVKAKIKLEKENKAFKKQIESLEVDNRWRQREIEKLKEKLREIRIIAGGKRIKIISRIKKWL